jgi:hypothetical protein
VQGRERKASRVVPWADSAPCSVWEPSGYPVQDPFELLRRRLLTLQDVEGVAGLHALLRPDVGAREPEQAFGDLLRARARRRRMEAKLAHKAASC